MLQCLASKLDFYLYIISKGYQALGGQCSTKAFDFTQAKQKQPFQHIQVSQLVLSCTNKRTVIDYSLICFYVAGCSIICEFNSIKVNKYKLILRYASRLNHFNSMKIFLHLKLWADVCISSPVVVGDFSIMATLGLLMIFF